jgi:spermidine/putrescine transport system substrate-binding protein
VSAQRALRLWCWEGYDQPAITTPFTQRSGIAVEAQTLISDAIAADTARANSDLADILNINNAYIAKDLHPSGRIITLESTRYLDAFATMLPQFERLYRWAWSTDQTQLIGICQRFGAFNLVTNTHLLSVARATDEGFALVQDPDMPFGVLLYDDFNIFHICISANLNPFKTLQESDFDAFALMAEHWFARAALVSADHHELNRALLDRHIAYYLSGGTYTASPARMAGHSQITAVTPRSGPIDGRGGIVFTEITSKLASPRPHPRADEFLEYLLEPDTAQRIAMLDGTCNPVAQMGDKRVFAKFSKQQLNAIQWDTLEEDIARCADYDQVPDHARLLALLHAATRRHAST